MGKKAKVATKSTSKPAKLEGHVVVDATKKVELHIMASDISKGTMKDQSSCAAARACVRELDCDAARVHLSRVYLFHNGKWVRYATPASLRSEIIAFDRGGFFTEGTHTLTPLPKSHRENHNRHRKDYKDPPRKKNPKARMRHHNISTSERPSAHAKGTMEYSKG